MTTCPNCGSSSEDYYCYLCGAILKQSSVVGAPGSSETIIGTINAQTGSTTPTLKDWDLHFTNNRVIISRIGSSGMAMFAGGLAGYGISKHSQREKREQLYGMNPEQILKSNVKNYYMPYNRIEAVKIKKGLMGSSITFWYNGERFKYKFPRSEYFFVEEMVNKYLRNKIMF